MPSHEPIDAIGYIRVSTAREEMISPDIQRDSIERWARAKNRHIVEWIEDLDETGRNFNRDIMRAITLVEQGNAQEIAVWKYSRFGRNRAGNALNLARLEQAGGQLQSATEQVDAKTSLGKLTRGVLMELAAFESDRTSEGWKDVHALRVQSGLPSGGTRRFGYIRKGRIPDPHQKHKWITDPNDNGGERYEIDPETGPLLADAYRRYASGQSFYQICAWLDSTGTPTPNRGTWGGNTLLDALDSGFGAGLLWVHDPECNHGDKKNCNNRIYIPGAHEPVIDNDTWERYLQRRRMVRNLAPRHRKSAHALSGIIKCGHCGGPMNAHKETRTQRGKRKGRVSWRCKEYFFGRCSGSRSISGERVMREVLRVLSEDADMIEKSAEEHTVTEPQQHNQLAEIDTEIARIASALDRLTERYVEDEIPKETYERTRDKYSARTGELERQRDEEARPREATPADYLPVIRGLLAEWDTLPVAQRNATLRSFLRIEAFRTGRYDAWVVMSTTYGTEHRVEVAERPGRHAHSSK